MAFGKILEVKDLNLEFSQFLFNFTHQVASVCQIEFSSAQIPLQQTFLKSGISSYTIMTTVFKASGQYTQTVPWRVS